MRRVICSLGILVLCFVAACRSEPEKHYPLKAEVISADPPRKLITVKHGEIPGLMPAMTMTYAVAEGREIEHLQPGDLITADLVVSESKGRLENITLTGHGTGTSSPGTTQHIPQPGDTVPDFALVNQNGKRIHFHDYAGKTLFVTFIYTRCPLADFCPRMNENFRAIQDVLRQQPNSLSRAAFLSISFDPDGDTPAVLKHYASIYDKPQPGQKQFDWQFAVPSRKNLPEVVKFFGLVIEPQQGQIVHSLSTTLIGPDGKVQQWYSGNDWKPEEVAQAIENVLAGSKS